MDDKVFSKFNPEMCVCVCVGVGGGGPMPKLQSQLQSVLEPHNHRPSPMCIYIFVD